MNHLTHKPGCPTTASAVASRGGTGLPTQGVCAVPNLPTAGDVALAAHEPRFEASFPAEPEAVSRVRRELRERLEEDGLGSIADDVVLICTELMANAILHGCIGFPSGITITVTVVWSDVQLRVGVRDPSVVRPREQEFSASRTSGRGLRLVDELSDRWGVEADPSGSGKTVWTELDCPRRRAS